MRGIEIDESGRDAVDEDTVARTCVSVTHDIVPVTQRAIRGRVVQLRSRRAAAISCASEKGPSSAGTSPGRKETISQPSPSVPRNRGAPLIPVPPDDAGVLAPKFVSVGMRLSRPSDVLRDRRRESLPGLARTPAEVRVVAAILRRSMAGRVRRTDWAVRAAVAASRFLL